MLFVALLALALLMPHTTGRDSWALILAFSLIMGRLLLDLREKA
jgi:hypothetical protein